MSDEMGKMGWGSGESLGEARERIRRTAMVEVRRRGRRRSVARGGVVVVVAVAIGALGMQQFVRLGGEVVADPGGGAIAAGSGAVSGAGEDGRVRWVQTDWSIGERLSATGIGRRGDDSERVVRVRWISDE